MLKFVSFAKMVSVIQGKGRNIFFSVSLRPTGAGRAQLNIALRSQLMTHRHVVFAAERAHCHADYFWYFQRPCKLKKLPDNSKQSLLLLYYQRKLRQLG